MILLEGHLEESVRTSPIIDEVIMKLRTIGLISILVLGLLAGPLPTEGQQLGKIHRIGYLSVRGPDREKRRLAAFHQELREHGILKDKILLLSTVTQRVRSNGTPT